MKKRSRISYCHSGSDLYRVTGIIFIILTWIPISSSAQSPYFKDAHPVYHFMDRTDVRYDLPDNFHLSVKPYSRETIFNSLKNIDTTQGSRVYRQNLDHILRDTLLFPDNNNSIPGSIYENPPHFYAVALPDFSLVINPMLYLSAGRDIDSDETLFRNTRGIELYGTLDNRFYFYTSFYENQASFYNYIRDYIGQYKAIRGQGNYKDYDHPFDDDLPAYDFSNSQAYLGFKMTEHSAIELGHGKHFIGNGIRSLLLDDSGQNYFYLKLKFNVWKLYYQTLFTELSAVSARYNPGNALIPKKYMAAHYLSIKPSQNFEFGLFETVVFSREDHFELQYLNPVIFYRSVEYLLDSPDNVLIGACFKWNLLNRISLYGQGILDEFNFSEFFGGSGWWANKWGLQMGVKYFNLLEIDHLDFQFEYNVVRPYTYSHWRNLESFPEFSLASYSHYNQPLAHPLGANFSELIFGLRYQPIRKLMFGVRYLYTLVGRNEGGNFGNDILISNESRVTNYDVHLLQGNRSRIHNIDLTASYEWLYSLYFDLDVRIRDEQQRSGFSRETIFIGGGIRYNFWTDPVDY